MGSPWIRPRPHTPFSPKFLMGFCSDGACECIGQMCSQYIALPVPEITIAVLGWGWKSCNRTIVHHAVIIFIRGVFRIPTYAPIARPNSLMYATMQAAKNKYA